jgi:glyoxylase-like metal-dependent hydrolase (beta-lactamase superfamily II)
VIEAAGRRWRVEIGHGHAPEQATLWGGQDLVIAGDQVLPGITPNLGVYATEPEADPVGEWLASCARLGGLAEPAHLALPGHRLPFTGLAERLGQLIAHERSSMARLLDHLAEPRTAIGCFPALYRRAIGDAEFGLAMGEAVGHLNHLRALGAIRRESGPDGAWLWRRRIDFSPDSAASAG